MKMSDESDVWLLRIKSTTLHADEIKAYWTEEINLAGETKGNRAFVNYTFHSLSLFNN